jgi:iron complex outermembrane recepter protein
MRHWGLPVQSRGVVSADKVSFMTSIVCAHPEGGIAMSFKARPVSLVSSMVLGVALLSPAAAQAQSEGESAEDSTEIIVTAQRRAEKSVDVPITVQTLNEEMLTTANVQDLSDISKITPSLRFDNAFAFTQPTIRGVGTAVVTSGGGPNVGIYVDGFYSPNPLASDFDLLSVRNIQVLKGPQGTLFGRNATGGAILVQSNDPSSETAGKLKASYGRFHQTRLQGYVTTGLSDNIAVDLEGSFRKGRGFARNITTGSKRDGDYENWSIRTGVKVDFSDSVSLLLRYSHSDVDDPTFLLTNSYVDPVMGITAANFAPPGSFTTNRNEYASDDKRFFRSKNDVFQGTFKADLGFADLTSYTQHRTENTDQSNDLDQIGLTIFQIGLPVYNKTFSQEFLLTSKPGSPLQWTAGLFYFQNRDTYRTFVDNGVALGGGRIPIGGSSTTTQTYAGYVDLTYEINPQLFLTAGGRLSHDEIDDAYYIVAFTGVRTPVTQAQSDAVKRDRFTPRVVLRYKPDDNSSIYASYTQGYKAGILDVGGSTGNPVAPETIDAFEVGYKVDSGALSFETAAFYYDYKNLQVSLFQGNPPSAQIINAASSEIYGLEGALRYNVSDAFQLNVGAAWTHARYKRFVNAPIYTRCPGVGGCGGGTSFFVAPVTLTDVTMQRTPSFTGNLGASYTADVGGGKLVLSGNLYYTSKFFFGPSGIQFPQSGYEIVSLRAQWADPSETYSVALWGDNVTNSRYLTQVQYNNFGIGSTWSQPTSYGIELGVKF